jgi:Winged helix DNA-binding domain
VTRAPTPTLNTRQLNRAVLARQLLLQRSRLTLSQVLEQMAGLQAQYAPSMYIGLWSRTSGFDRALLTTALEKRQVVQGTMMRATIHLVSAADYWPLITAIRDSRRQWWIRVTKWTADPAEMEEVASIVADFLADGPKKWKEVEDLVGKETATAVGCWIDLVRAPPSGTWERRRADLYADASKWIAPVEVSLEEARVHLVRRYLGAFGPATPSDIATWAGLPPGELVPTVERLRLRRFRTEEGTELIDLPGAPLPDPDVNAPVRFLPTWDASLLVHCRRARLIPEEFRPHIFSTKMPQSVGTFMIDGAVAGSWRFEGDRIRTDLFEPVAVKWHRDVEREAEALAKFCG